MICKETSTITKNDDGTYNLLIQNERGHVTMEKRSIPFSEAVYELEMAMYVKGVGTDEQ